MDTLDAVHAVLRANEYKDLTMKRRNHEVKRLKYVNWILVPIDFSDDSRRALEAADAQAARAGSGLIVLHVRKPQASTPTRLSIGKGSVEKWSRYITQTAPERVAYITCAGDPVDEILRVAEQHRPLKIIMGRGGDKRQAGSVTRAVGAGFPGIVEAISTQRNDVFIHASVA